MELRKVRCLEMHLFFSSRLFTQIIAPCLQELIIHDTVRIARLALFLQTSGAHITHLQLRGFQLSPNHISSGVSGPQMLLIHVPSLESLSVSFKSGDNVSDESGPVALNYFLTALTFDEEDDHCPTLSQLILSNVDMDEPSIFIDMLETRTTHRGNSDVGLHLVQTLTSVQYTSLFESPTSRFGNEDMACLEDVTRHLQTFSMQDGKVRHESVSSSE
ncbi:hypothetical protein BDV98DRAFT_566134 [Pterulicium gracile]|uniref:Uncharacterized protein n=1 Tax=Pterulicium gracile TaxID=1884261 RepID=A0A5C3QL08_9AGAR|nr:hypothetical protein BDV98DRAFT_566134 [Pterula gracilis]